MPRPLRIISMSVVALGVAAGAAACTSGDGSTASSPPPVGTTSVAVPTATVTTTTSATATATASPSRPATSSPATSSGPAQCSGRHLSVSHTNLGGATGHSGVKIVFTNTGSTTCTLTGYPGAAVLDASGKQIEQAKRTRSGFLGGCDCTPRTISLAPSQHASSEIEGNNGGGDECLRGRALLVTPPNTTHSTRISFEDYSCDVEVHPTVAGRSGGTR